MFETNGRKEVTVRGIVVTEGSSRDDDMVVLQTWEETEVLIDPRGVGRDLRDFLHEEVEARGVMRHDAEGRLVLTVKGFEVCAWSEDRVDDDWPG